MKNAIATLKLDEDMTEYLTYAAAIEGKTAEKYTAKLCRKFRSLHPSLKRGYTVQAYIMRDLWLTIDHHEWRHRLPKSYAQSKNPRESTLNRCWDNMIANRAALGV